MYISADFEAPNGATAHAHRFAIEEPEDGLTHVRVNCFAAPDSTYLIWQLECQLRGDTSEAAVAKWLVSDHGPFPGGSVIDEDPLRLRKDELLQHVELRRDAYINRGYATRYGIFDTDPQSMRNLAATNQAAIVAQTAEQPFEVSWRLEDNSSVLLTGEEFIQIFNSITEWVSHCYERSWQLKEEIEEATAANINFILLDHGWRL